VILASRVFGRRSSLKAKTGRRFAYILSQPPAGDFAGRYLSSASLAVPGVLDHLTTRLGAVAARLGTRCHVLVGFDLLAGGGARVARLGATFANRHAQRAEPSRQPCCRGANFRTVHAQVHRLGVLFLALGNQVGAVVKARITLLLAVRARLG